MQRFSGHTYLYLSVFLNFILYREQLMFGITKFIIKITVYRVQFTKREIKLLFVKKNLIMYDLLFFLHRQIYIFILIRIYGITIKLIKNNPIQILNHQSTRIKTIL